MGCKGVVYNEQGGDKVVTRWWQCCDNTVNNVQGGDKVVTRWWQGCDNIVYNAHGGDKVVTRLFPASKVMTGLSQPCDKVIQHTYNLVKDKLKPTMNTDIWVWGYIYKIKTLHSRWSSEVKLAFKIKVLLYIQLASYWIYLLCMDNVVYG